MEPIDQAKTDAQGNFTINQAPPRKVRPCCARPTTASLTTTCCRPARPPPASRIDVYNASKQPGAAKVSKHMMLFEPTGGQMTVNETFLFENNGKTTWNDPDERHAALLPARSGQRQRAGQGHRAGRHARSGRAADKTAKPDIYKVDFPVKPGETRFDLTYTVPYTEGAPYDGKIVTKDENTYLIVPNGVTLEGDRI